MRILVRMCSITPTTDSSWPPKNFLSLVSRKYRGANKGLHVLLSMTQAGPGRTVKQEQEEISHNHVQTFIYLSVLGCFERITYEERGSHEDQWKFSRAVFRMLFFELRKPRGRTTRANLRLLDSLTLWGFLRLLWMQSRPLKCEMVGFVKMN